MAEASTGVVSVAVVGTGKIADQHLAALRKSSRARLVGVVDINPARAAAAGYSHGGAPATTRLDDVLADPACDAVIICTPNTTHAQIGQACAAAGKHVLMEKPLATTVDDAAALHTAFAERGLVLAAAHTHRSWDYSRSVKQALESGDIATPRLLRLAILGGWTSWGDWRSWVLDPALSGGHPLHNGVHLLDTVCWWMGDRPVRVYARGAKNTSAALRIDDYLEMVLTFAGGGVAVCEMSRSHRPSRFAMRDVLAVGDEGIIALPDGSDAGAVHDDAGSGAIPAVPSDAFTRQLDAWLDALAGGQPLADSHDGVLAVIMAVAAGRSIDTGQPVDLADLAPAVDGVAR